MMTELGNRALEQLIWDHRHLSDVHVVVDLDGSHRVVGWTQEWTRTTTVLGGLTRADADKLKRIMGSVQSAGLSISFPRLVDAHLIDLLPKGAR